MDQEIATDVSDASWPELSADLTLARTQARSIMLDTQRANSDGRILELAAQLELMRTRMTSLEQHIFEAQTAIPQDLADHLGRIDATLLATEARFEQFSSRVSSAEEFASTTMLSTTASMDARMDAVDVARRAQTAELEELSTFLEQSFTRISELAQVIDTERDLSAANQVEHDSHFAALTSKMSAVEQSLADLGARIDEAHQSAEAASVEALDALGLTVANHGTRLTHLETVVSNAGERISGLDDRVATNATKQDEIASAIHFLQSRAEAIEATASTHSSEMIEHVNFAHQRLDAGLADIASLRSELDEAEPAVDPELVAELEKRIDDHATEQTAVLRTLDEVATSFEARIGQQDGVLQTHSTILDAATQLLTEHDQIGSSNTSAITELIGRIDGHQSGIQALSEQIDSHGVDADALGERVSHAERIAEQAIAAAATTATVSETILESKTSELESRLDEATQRIDELDVPAPDDTAAVEKIAELEPVVHTHDEQIEAVNDWVTIVDGRIIDIQQQGETTQQQIEAVNDWVTIVDGRIIDIQQQGETTQQQIEAVNDWTTNLDDRTAALEHRSKLVKTQLDDLILQYGSANSATDPVTSDELASLTDRIEGFAPQIDAQGQMIEAVNDRVEVVDSRVEEVRQSGETTQKQIEAVNDWAIELDRRSTEIAAGTLELSDRTDAIDSRTNQLEERFGEAANRIDQLDRERAEFSIAERTVPANELAQINDQIEAVTPLIDAHENQIEAVNDWVTVVDGRIVELQSDGETVREQIEAVNDWATNLDGRIVGMHADNEMVHEQIEAVNDWATNLEIRTFEMDTRLSQAQHALVEMSNSLATVAERGQPDAGLKQQVDELAVAITELRARAHENSGSIDASTIASQVAATERSVQETHTSVQQWIQTVEQTSAEANNELRDFVVYRIDSAEDRMDRRLADIESSGSGTDRIEAIERAVNEADERARDAYAFSENLRLLQTDLVQAIRSEMATQADQIERHGHALQNSGALVPAPGSGEGLSAVSTQVDELSSAVSHLNELQRRHSTVESTLTEALTSTNAALGKTQQNVVSLRGELENALKRIAQLEARM